MTVLEDILARKRAEVADLRRAPGAHALRDAAAAAGPPRAFATALARADGRLAVIAELKRRSPSKGVLAPELDPGTVAAAYEAGGAAALSVLTDGPSFGGSLDDLRAARAATGLPVLRKDFVLDAVQVDEARAAGADAVLLIVAALRDPARVAALEAYAADLGMAAVVEVHSEAELEVARRARARVVGVNARDLTTFEEDLDAACRLAAGLPEDVVKVAESAIRSPEDARRAAEHGFDAVLVGEMLVRRADRTAGVRSLAELRVRAAPAAGGDR